MPRSKKRGRSGRRTEPAPSLELIEGAGDTPLPRDPDAAFALLPELDDSAPDGEIEESTPKRRDRPRRKAESKAQLRSRLEAAESKLAEASAGPDQAQQLADVAHASSGTVVMVTDLYIGTHAEREGWRWTPEEAARWGELWAPPLLPWLPTLGAMAPWLLAAFGTGQLVIAKRTEAIKHARAVEEHPEQVSTIQQEP